MKWMALIVSSGALLLNGGCQSRGGHSSAAKEKEEKKVVPQLREADSSRGTDQVNPESKSDGASPFSGWLIRSSGVGPVVLGEPLPNELLNEELESAYVARWIADGVPWEGFKWASFPLWVGISGGPFSKAPSYEPELLRLRAKGAAMARQGARVSGVSISAAGPVTESGVGVGSSLSALQQTHPGLLVHSVPPTWGEDECVAYDASLPGVYFLFASCPAAKSGAPVSRIDVRKIELDEE